MPTPAIEFDGVTKTYQKRLSGQTVSALADVSFSVFPGEVCAFLGPNGAGKTTSISILMGFLRADSGEIRVLDFAPGDVRAKQHIGFLPENFAFYKYLNARKLLKFHAALAGVRESDAQRLIPELLKTVKLNGFEGLKISKYSRGMVQRLGIAQALIGDPRLLILDEPTSGLDPAGRKDVRDLIASVKRAGKTVLLSSHILSEVEQIADRVVIVDRGRVLRSGTMAELLQVSARVEVIADRVPEGLEAMLVEWAATTERITQGVRILIPAQHKRQLAEALWSQGCDVIGIAAVKGSLEELFLKVVGGGAPS